MTAQTTDPTDTHVTFNLLDEPWIPCLVPGPLGSVTREDLSLRAALERAHEIIELSDSSPLITVSLYRLLIALAHRVYGPRSIQEWWALWDAGHAGPARLAAYLDAGDRHARFDLFDPTRPFYQVPGLDGYGASIAKLTHEHASSGNAVLLMDHGRGVAGTGLTPAAAARYLVAFQAYAVGGLISYEKGQDPKIYKSAAAGPLVKGAVLLVRGRTLWQTLLLNMVQYPRESQPARHAEPDLPAWERDSPVDAQPRLPTGLLDLLTWQSRRVHLFPERAGQGGLVVRQVAAMKGHPIDPVFERRSGETMMAFTYKAKAKVEDGQDPHPPLVFRDERALWRDSMALVPLTGSQDQRPGTLRWLGSLGLRSRLGFAALPIDALGMRSDQAKILAWHHERLSLPLAYLEDGNQELFGQLRTGLELADGVGRAVRESVHQLAKLLINTQADHREARQPLPADVNGLAASLGGERIYWAALDMPFARLLADLPGDPSVGADADEDDDEDGVHARAILDEWARTLRRAAGEAYDAVAGGLDGSARALKAGAIGRRVLRSRVATALGAYGHPAPVDGAAEQAGMASPAMAR